MPWVIRDVVNDLNKAVARRWHSVDPLLPEPNDLPEGCTAPFLASGGNGRPAGLGVCRHQHVPADTLAQTWGAATKFVLTLLHYSQMNPLSAPFWHRMGYRPLWTTWEARPAASLR